jgi:hypothetical protein
LFHPQKLLLYSLKYLGKVISGTESVQKRQVVAIVIVVAVITLALGATIGYGIPSGRIMTSIITQTQTITYSALIPITTTQTRTTISITTSDDFTEIIPIVATSATTTTLSVTTISVTSYSLLFSGASLLENYGNIFGNSSITIDCNNSALSFNQIPDNTMNLAVNGDMNQLIVSGGQLNLVINGNNNTFYTTPIETD